MRKFKADTIFLLSILFLMLAITPVSAEEGTGSSSAGAPVSSDLLQKGLNLYMQGEYAASLPLLQAGLKVEPDAERRNRARRALALIHLTEKKYDAALKQVAAIPIADRNDQDRFVEGQALIAINLTREGVAALRSVQDEYLSEADRLARWNSLARGNAELGNSQQALWFAHKVMRADPDGSDELYDFCQQLIHNKVDPMLLPEIAFMFADSPIAAAARMQVVKGALAAGDRQKALMEISQVDLGKIPAAYRSSAVGIYTALTGESWLQRAIGVVLPLSGRYSDVGNLIKRGMDLAVELQEESGSEVRFIYRDGAGDADTSRKAVSRLAGDKAIGIIGPLTGGAALAAAEQAEIEKLPLLTISQRDGLPEIGPYVFRNSLTSQLQAQALARYAVEGQGLTSFGVLYPDNKTGREMARLFSAEVKKLNGLVTDIESYSDDANDFGRQIKLLRGEDPNFNPETMTEQEILEDLFVPDFPPVSFDALFIPDYADRVGMIAPQLAYYGIENVPLLGIASWNSPELLRLAGSFVEGAVFVDGFFSYSTYPFVRDFVDRYYNKYGEEPTLPDALGYDVANIMIAALSREDIRSRDDLRLALSQLANYPGVTGATSFNLIGEADKVLFVLQIENGNIIQVNGPENETEEVPDSDAEVNVLQ